MQHHIIAIVGMCGSGKSVVTEWFCNNGYYQIHFGDFTMIEVKRRNLPVTESNEKKIREELRKEHGPDAYAKLALPQINQMLSVGNVVIDGMYSWSEYKFLKERFNNRILVVSIVSDLRIRKLRLSTRTIRPLTSEEVDKRDYAEIENIEKGGPISHADYFICNNSGLDDLIFQCNEVFKCINSHLQNES
ncbi:MAG: dephospho-CoA kinase [Ruminococcaceae bacterium]|nr:dephospho-CoA kinase [Oscillospiraceae bacterium]